MRNLLMASIAILGLSAATAFAGEGNGDPFPGPNAAITTTTTGAHLAMAGQDPFEYHSPTSAMSLKGFHQAAPGSQNPYPFSATGMTLNVGPASPAAIAGTQGPGQTSFGASAPAGFHG